VSARGGAVAARRLMDELCVVSVGGGALPARPVGGVVLVTAGALSEVVGLRPDVVFSFGGPGVVGGARVVWARTAVDALRRWNEVAG
jgi:hypothetical protein